MFLIIIHARAYSIFYPTLYSIFKTIIQYGMPPFFYQQYGMPPQRRLFWCFSFIITITLLRYAKNLYSETCEVKLFILMHVSPGTHWATFLLMCVKAIVVYINVFVLIIVAHSISNVFALIFPMEAGRCGVLCVCVMYS